ncbi:tRNA pseudouridine(55) synthase TruB [Brevibacillus sp. SYP-B805]|uniref:tRNA pseudouridine(55) synthase TruB n=1 Tax=Brevibacillus sp. SYP-B805 TaxID=1578199 RepID=UPI0013EAD017|nr:tRNA pseudouridine(55) synthase TruB [Brevibacillus sp. SYP-B805]NGQ94056.1 tRNA pseudouridine(55) synthase TruB [Brevibacillus sp. SYP-B805]
MNNPHGVLVVHKPAGMTSHDCVMRVRRLFQTKKAGHTGTLDPEVSGVLPVCIGHATRIVEYLQELPKTYEAVMCLGSSTTTEDATGDVLEQLPVDASVITEERVRAVFQRFLGEIEQVPPMYSAVKVKGKRLYDLAREGKTVERPPRTVTIYDLQLASIRAGEQVEIAFACRCSKGTYIRTLCVDIGKALGYPAHMSRLVRTGSGPFTLEDAVTLDALEKARERGEDLSAYLLPIEQALSFLPRHELPAARKKAVLNGLETSLPDAAFPEGSLVCLFSEGRLLGIHRVCKGPTGSYAKAEKVFPAEVGM